MTQKTDTILDRIVADKRGELAAATSDRPLAELQIRARNAPPVRPFAPALRGARVALIAEVKKASPSRGLLRADFDPAALATAYANAGAAAISVLTDEKYFQGSLADLAAIRKALPDGPPLLRKDFLIDKYQVYEARCTGADAVLLICAILEPELLRELMTCAQSLGMGALVEVHEEKELQVAVSVGADLIGINNRDLKTFETTLAVSKRLVPSVPADHIVVGESGIVSPADLEELARVGISTFLVGESLMREHDVEAATRALIRRERRAGAAE